MLRSGGYLLSFGGTRTFHRIASGIEDAGFDIKDCLSWNYGSGFPKSHNISKAIDKNAGNVRERVPIVDISNGKEKTKDIGKGWKMTSNEYTTYSDEAIHIDAERWNGYGTALKPSWEPIILAQKPFKGTIVNNVLAHGVGGMNIGATRISHEDPDIIRKTFESPLGMEHCARTRKGERGAGPSPDGRWPANTIFDEAAGAILNEQSGECKTGSIKPYMSDGSKSAFIADESFRDFSQPASSGGAARFFYCPKTPKKEKTCIGFVDNKHPTVKPIKLMEWLIKLVCPTADAMGRQPVIIDCFVGSGSTALAANRVGVDCIGIDADSESLKTARLRLMNDWRLEKSSNLKLRGFITKQTIEEEE